MMMFSFLFLIVLVFILVVGVIAGITLLNKNNGQEGNPFSVIRSSEKQKQVPSPDMKRFCSHCGAGLQGDWTHCPQCGAPVGS